ncbi:VanZ family protein [Maricaulis sp.]|jgi:VanZ family protein|uniref:VanZ family protein n=1 Tax=Maricaulis sp. TaxID=1486257 RepID=UPI002602D984|nr:VanZ family protein [Maricaulis sp.]
MTLRWAGRILFVAAIIVITDLALQPGHAMPATLLGSDKLEHLAAFAVLTVLAHIAWPGVSRWFTVPILVLYGIGIELAQASLTVGRTASLADLGADTLGILVGLGLLSLVRPGR